MARKSIVISTQRKLEASLKAKSMTADQRKKKRVFAERAYNRCKLCGRRHGYMRFFGVCRICFRELASNGDIPGITKSSW
jgi:small subunit ribosomal protein S14